MVMWLGGFGGTNVTDETALPDPPSAEYSSTDRADNTLSTKNLVNDTDNSANLSSPTGLTAVHPRDRP